MIKDLKSIAADMQELGLAALARVNSITLTYDKWTAVLAVLQTAHAMEILAKARIAQEHPLLLFDTYPEPKKDPTNCITSELTLSQLSERGKTIEWSDLIKMLWVVADIKTINITKFSDFGKLRNAIQHFGIVPDKNISYLTSLEFVYNVIDPFIYECWGFYAIDYCQDYAPDCSADDNELYWKYIKECLIQNEVHFHVSPTLIKYKEYWWTDDEAEYSKAYCEYMQSQLNEQISQI